MAVRPSRGQQAPTIERVALNPPEQREPHPVAEAGNLAGVGQKRRVVVSPRQQRRWELRGTPSDRPLLPTGARR